MTIRRWQPNPVLREEHAGATGQVFKRAFDILGGTVLALIALPIIVLGAIASTIVLRAWPFFVQERVGRGGRRFRVVKIRTLPKETRPDADKYEIRQIKIGFVCRTMRRLHLDELPQLFLVPLGRMSLVGPRPEMPCLHDDMPESLAMERTSVRPGCTGLWQISVAKIGLIRESPEYDRLYIRVRTFRLDLWILLLTARQLLPRGRMITLEDIPAWVRRERDVGLVVAPSALGFADEPELVFPAYD